MSLSSNINALPISRPLFNILLCSSLSLLVRSIPHFLPLTVDAGSLSQTNGARNVGVSNLSDEATQFQTIRLALCVMIPRRGSMWQTFAPARRNVRHSWERARLRFN